MAVSVRSRFSESMLWPVFVDIVRSECVVVLWPVFVDIVRSEGVVDIVWSGGEGRRSSFVVMWSVVWVGCSGWSVADVELVFCLVSAGCRWSMIVAFCIDCFVRCIPIFSMGSEVSRSPAVSINRKRIPLISVVSSIVSLVVPGMLVTIALSYPRSEFRSDDFPAFG